MACNLVSISNPGWQFHVETASYFKKKQFCISPMIFLRDWNSIKKKKWEESNSSSSSSSACHYDVASVQNSVVLPFSQQMIWVVVFFAQFYTDSHILQNSLQKNDDKKE